MPAYRRLIVIISAVLAFASLVSSASSPGRADAASTVQLLVHFRAGSGAEHAKVLSSAGVRGGGTIPRIGVQVVTVGAASAAAALAKLKHDPGVAFAESDSSVQPQEDLPSDPYFPQQYALGGGAWGWYQTHTTQAWDVTQGSPSTVIAILDTGIKTSGLDDFNGQIASTWNVVTGTADVSTNAGNHGTYVAGVAGLALGNGVGNAGVCPGCKLMIVQVGTDAGAQLGDLASGLVWAADHGARVANLSWAGTSNSATLQTAIDYARSKGLVVTAAAGNSNCNCVTYPAADNGVLGVAGTDSSGKKAGDSNYGSWVSIAAPEGNLTGWPMINGAPGYAPVGGTSIAAPFVAGVAGLLFSFNPSLTNVQVEQALEATAAPAAFSVASGRVDALAALQYVGAIDPQAPSAPLQTAPPQLYYELGGTTSIAPLTSAPQVGQVLVRGIGGWSGSSGLSVSGLQWQRCSSSGTGCSALASTSTYTVQSTDAGSAIKLVFTVKNALGSVPVSVLSLPVGGSAAASSPVNVALPAVSGTAQAGQALTASTGSWSGSPTSYTYQWSRCSTSGAGCSPVAGATSSNYTVQSADVASTLAVRVTALNSAGSASASSSPTPTVSAATPNQMTQTATFSGSLNNGNPAKSFAVTVGAGVAHAQLAFSKCNALTLALSNGVSSTGPSVVTLDQTLVAGTYTYTVSGGKCAFTLTVTSPLP